ncbi:MAG TPA: SRPBCC family protein [Solirubrobacterales bacterium]|nr:SRPBCC family protein [Solirubrobacterales bacterium]
MRDGPTAIRWPDRHRPEVSSLHAVNELQIAAPRERVWELLRRPDLWPTYYRNARFVRHLGGPWPAVELGTRFRWFTFGVIVVSEIVEFEPPERIAWSAKELGAEGHHAWLLSERDGGAFVHTEETQRGWGMTLARPAMSRLMPRQHQRWLEGLAQVAAVAGVPGR